MPRWNSNLLLGFFAMLVMTACVKPAPELSTFAKPDIDFSAFRTYQWQDQRPETAIMQAQSDLLHRMIVQTTEEELAADGLTKSTKADLVVDYRVTVSPQKGFWQSLFAAESATPGSYNLRSAEAQTSSFDERTLRQGVLVIELRDRNDLVVWAGRASIVAAKGQPSMVVNSVRRILAQYPPPR